MSDFAKAVLDAEKRPPIIPTMFEICPQAELWIVGDWRYEVRAPAAFLGALEDAYWGDSPRHETGLIQVDFVAKD
jgi:hypothetical protein